MLTSHEPPSDDPPADDQPPGAGRRTLALGFVALAALITTYVVLGPLLTERIRFSTSASGLNQIRGGDLAALCVVVPACLAVAWLLHRGHPAGPVLGLAPATFAMYTYSQLALGNEYLDRPGNLERWFLLLLALFVLAATLAVTCWAASPPASLPATSRRLERRSGVLLLVMAFFVVVGLHLPSFVDALRSPAEGAAYLATPNTFWVVKFYDLGIVVPAAIAVGLGLLQRRTWARKPAYAILGGYVLLAWSVAGMGWTMTANSDPDASLVVSLLLTALAVAGTVFAFYLYRPLLRSGSGTGTGTGQVSAGRLSGGRRPAAPAPARPRQG